MRPTHAPTSAGTLVGLLRGPGAACGRVTVSWTLAGAVGGGGVLVSALTVAGYVTPGLQLLAAPVLFLLGAVSGAIHGVLLAVAGRPQPLTRGGALRAALLALLVAVPALAPAWIVTAAISLTAALVAEWRPLWAFLSAGGWIIGVGVCLWAVREGWCSAGRALRRWDDGRVGTALTTGILVVASSVLLHVRPRIWGTDLRLNGVGAVILALVFTLWVGLPLVWAALHVAHDRRGGSLT